MIIEKLYLENWKSFHKSHEFDFNPVGDASLSVVLAEGSRGKSSLVDSIRWLLLGNKAQLEFGSVFSHFPPAEKTLLNRDAADEGNMFFSVKMDVIVCNVLQQRAKLKKDINLRPLI